MRRGDESRKAQQRRHCLLRRRSRLNRPRNCTSWWFIHALENDSGDECWRFPCRMGRVRSNATRLGEQTDYFVVVSVIVDPSEPCWIDRARICERKHRDERCHQKQCDEHQEWLPTSGGSGYSHSDALPLFMGGPHCAPDQTRLEL